MSGVDDHLPACACTSATGSTGLPTVSVFTSGPSIPPLRRSLVYSTYPYTVHPPASSHPAAGRRSRSMQQRQSPALSSSRHAGVGPVEWKSTETE